MSDNKAAWLMAKQSKPFTIDTAPVPEPTETQVIVRNYAVAINPCDAGIQNMGIIWEEYPAIIGSDIAGEVVAIGSGVKDFKKGDRVIGCVEEGGFQLYTPADVRLIAKLPSEISYTKGVVLPLTLTTAASIFHPDNLGLPPPEIDSKPNGQTVLVWGGASSVGSCAIQLLRGAGYEVIATASPHNFQYCKDLGAAAVFNYKDENIVDQIVEAFGKRHFAGAFSAIFRPTDAIHSCAAIADKLSKDEKTRIVATVIPSNMAFTETIPDGVRIAYCDGPTHIVPGSKMAKLFGITETTPNDVGPAVWGRWVSPALANGTLQCKPDPEVVGQGLEAIQEAVDRMAAGVSAKKLVVELP